MISKPGKTTRCAVAELPSVRTLLLLANPWSLSGLSEIPFSGFASSAHGLKGCAEGENFEK
jgi:hypothetical protein